MQSINFLWTFQAGVPNEIAGAQSVSVDFNSVPSWKFGCNVSEWLEIEFRNWKCKFLSWLFLFFALHLVKINGWDLCAQIRLDSANILMPNLKTAQPPTSQANMPSTLLGGRPEHQMHNKVYQLCACASGKLFLAAPHSVCAGDESTVCRWFCFSCLQAPHSPAFFIPLTTFSM